MSGPLLYRCHTDGCMAKDAGRLMDQSFARLHKGATGHDVRKDEGNGEDGR